MSLVSISYSNISNNLAQNRAGGLYSNGGGVIQHSLVSNYLQKKSILLCDLKVIDR